MEQPNNQPNNSLFNKMKNAVGLGVVAGAAAVASAPEHAQTPFQDTAMTSPADPSSKYDVSKNPLLTKDPAQFIREAGVTAVNNSLGKTDDYILKPTQNALSASTMMQSGKAIGEHNEPHLISEDPAISIEKLEKETIDKALGVVK